GPTGATGPTGDTGPTGAPGADGPAALLVQVPEPAGANCANGGTKIQSGIDSDHDGVLSDAERTSTTYVCDGQPGQTGTPGTPGTLLTVTMEGPGANCSAGGLRIDAGLDGNANGALDPTEVTKTSYVCDGRPGGGGGNGSPDAGA